MYNGREQCRVGVCNGEQFKIWCSSGPDGAVASLLLLANELVGTGFTAHYQLNQINSHTHSSIWGRLKMYIYMDINTTAAQMRFIAMVENPLMVQWVG